MFDALDRADKYRKGRKTKKRSPKFHMIGEQSSNPPELILARSRSRDHAQDFTQCGETKQPETARSGSGIKAVRAYY